MEKGEVETYFVFHFHVYTLEKVSCFYIPGTRVLTNVVLKMLLLLMILALYNCIIKYL